MSSLTVRLFGPPRIEQNGAALDLDHRKPLALLTYLLVTAAPHTREALATFFWPDHANARNYLRNNLSIIRHALGDDYDRWITINRQTIAWRDFDNTWIDVAEFERCLAIYRSHNHADGDLCPSCVEHLSQAVSLAGADFLAGFALRDSPPFDEWCYYHREHLRADTSAALDALACFHSRSGSLATAIAFARSRLTLDEYYEPAHRQLMELYAQSDQHALALHQYEMLEVVLRTELDVAPTEETSRLIEAIKQRRYPPSNQNQPVRDHEAVGQRTNQSGGRQVREVAPPRNNLPVPLTPLIGRDRELAEIRAMLADPGVRLITLTGSGGVGKTRLSQTVAAELLPHFIDGAHLVQLATVRKPALVPSAIAEALDIHMAPERQVIETLKIVLGDSQILLVFFWNNHPLEADQTVQTILQLVDGAESSSSIRREYHDRNPAVLPPVQTGQGFPPEFTRGHATLLAVAGYYAFLNTRHATAYRLFSQGLDMNERLDEPMAPIYKMMALGLSATHLFYCGEYDRAVDCYRKTIAVPEDVGDEWSVAMNETNLGKMLSRLGEFEEANVLIERALLRLRAIGQAWGIAKTLCDYGHLHLLAGRHQIAAQALEESLSLCVTHLLGDLEAGARERMGLLAVRNGDYASAASLLRDALLTRRKRGGSHYIIETIEMVLEYAVDTGQLKNTMRLAGAIATQRRHFEILIPPILGASVERLITEARDQLDSYTADRAWAEGQTLSLDDATTLAIQVCDTV